MDVDAAEELKKDLPVSMTVAAFVGISWYICVELNIRLFFTFKRRDGLYFWSCLLCSWGVLIQPMAMILTDFAVWKDKVIAMVVIYLSWFIMVVPQSFVLYSRLDLVMSNSLHLRWVLIVLIITSTVFSIPTMITGVLAQTTMNQTLGPPYLVWDKIQLTAFFVQETLLSLVYIVETRRRLKGSSMIHHDSESREILHHLIYVNAIVIFLDCSLLALSYANFFYVQSAYKPCVYGVKLRVEFAILNRLKMSVQPSSHLSYRHGDLYDSSGAHEKTDDVCLESVSRGSQRSGVQMIQNASRTEPDLEALPTQEQQIVQTTEISIVSGPQNEIFPAGDER